MTTKTIFALLFSMSALQQVAFKGRAVMILQIFNSKVTVQFDSRFLHLFFLKYRLLCQF